MPKAEKHALLNPEFEISMHRKRGHDIMCINGLPVYDAKRSLKVAVENIDIEKAHGHEKDPTQCVFAQAICRLYPNVAKCWVHKARVYIHFDGEKCWWRFACPPRMRQEIVVYDRHGEPAPSPPDQPYTLRPISEHERENRGHRSGSDAPGARDRGSKDRRPKRPRGRPVPIPNVRVFGGAR